MIYLGDVWGGNRMTGEGTGGDGSEGKDSGRGGIEGGGIEVGDTEGRDSVNNYVGTNLDSRGLPYDNWGVYNQSR